MKNIISRSIIFSLALSVAVVGMTSTTASSAPNADNHVKVIISFDRAPGAAERALVRGAGGDIRHTYNIVPAIAASVPEAAIAGLSRNPNVTSVELDGLVYATTTYVADDWGVDRIEAPAVHTNDNTGAGVKVAIIDTGIDYTHPELISSYKGGYDFVNNDADPMDDEGHGTHVSGTIAADDDGVGVTGVAPDADIYALKVLNSSGSGYWSDIIAAVDWTVANGIQVTNNSYGGGQNPGGAVQAAFDNAAAAGILHISSAGNSGNPKGKGNNVGYPARYDSVVAVAATDRDDLRASFSSTGDKVELSAPGVGILSTKLGGGYETLSGTSMASPHVAGTAALVIAAGVADVRDEMNLTSEDLGDAGRDPQYGYGLVNALAAVNYGGSPPPPPPPPPGGEAAIVDSVSYSTEGGQLSDKHLNTVISLVDDSSSPVVGAGVSIVLYLDDSALASWSASTDTNGNATFSLKNAPSGCYTTVVTEVTGVNWDSITPVNEFCK